MRRRPTVAVLAAVVVGGALGGCSQGSDRARGDGTAAGGGRGAGPCGTPTPAPSTAGLPDRLALDSLGTFTRVVRDGGFVNATAVTHGSLSELDAEVSRGLQRAGYTIVGSENEIIEADIFFARGADTTGGVKFIQGPCDGEVTVRLFLSQPVS